VLSLAANNPWTPCRRPQRAKAPPPSTEALRLEGPQCPLFRHRLAAATFPTDLWWRCFGAVARCFAPAQPELNFLSLRRRVGEKASCRGFGSVLELGTWPPRSREKVLLHVLQFWLRRVRELNSVGCRCPEARRVRWRYFILDRTQQTHNTTTKTYTKELIPKAISSVQRAEPQGPPTRPWQQQRECASILHRNRQTNTTFR